jgi:hypothetical protein
MQRVEPTEREGLEALTGFDGIRLNEDLYGRVAVAYLDMASATVALSRGGGPGGLFDRVLGVAAAASLGSLNALVSGVSAECTLGAPPMPISAGPDSVGRLVYRCAQDRMHSWDMAGNRLS